MLETQHEDKVLVIKLCRPEVKNAISDELLGLIADSLIKADQNDNIQAAVIYGTDQFFAAGADISELAQKDMVATANDVRTKYWHSISRFSKPLIAAVNGYALGAGCELAMTCDIIIAGHDAQFGQPEIKLGIIPGAGGSQRLTKAVGKSLAMQMVLTGQPINARQALTHNLVSEITDNKSTLQRALTIATTIGKHSPIALKLAKQSINNSFETGLSGSINFERQCFISLAESADKKHLIDTFLNKTSSTK